MRILAISGSAKAGSRSGLLLNALNGVGGADVVVFEGLAGLPIFSPDLEGPPAPEPVESLLAMMARADAVVICSPEYVRSFPGGLKNAIDWCVSRPEIIGKPIALAHASHRGDEMLMQLRRVLETVSDRFAPQIFLRLAIAAVPIEEAAAMLAADEAQAALRAFLSDLSQWISGGDGISRAFGGTALDAASGLP